MQRFALFGPFSGGEENRSPSHGPLSPALSPTPLPPPFRPSPALSLLNTFFLRRTKIKFLEKRKKKEVCLHGY